MTLNTEHAAGGSIAAIGACYYTTPREMAKLSAQFLRSLLPSGYSAQTHLVAMRPGENLPTAEGTSVSWARSSGNYLDISAYYTGALAAGKHDAYVLFNDTLFTKHAWRQMGARMRPMVNSLRAVRAPAAAGEIHPTTDLILEDSRNPARRHLSTFGCMLNEEAFQLFKKIVANLPEAGTDQAMRDWLHDQSSAHTPLKHLLNIHVLGPANPWTWKGKLKGGIPENLLLRKAIGVVIEYLFSEQVLRNGGFVMPVNSGLKYRLHSKAAEIRARLRS